MSKATDAAWSVRRSREVHRRLLKSMDTDPTCITRYMQQEDWGIAKIAYYHAEADAEAAFELALQVAREKLDAARAAWHASGHPQAEIDRRELSENWRDGCGEGSAARCEEAGSCGQVTTTPGETPAN